MHIAPKTDALLWYLVKISDTEAIRWIKNTRR